MIRKLEITDFYSDTVLTFNWPFSTARIGSNVVLSLKSDGQISDNTDAGTKDLYLTINDIEFKPNFSDKELSTEVLLIRLQARYQIENECIVPYEYSDSDFAPDIPALGTPIT